MRVKRTAILIVLVSLLLNLSAYGQSGISPDTAPANVSYHDGDSTALQSDKTAARREDVSATDIGSSRGIFILSADRMLQLRIWRIIRPSIP